jgi:hypothetical protein
MCGACSLHEKDISLLPFLESRLKINTKLSSEHLMRRDHLEDLGLDGDNIKRDITNRLEGSGLNSAGLGQGRSEGSCEQDWWVERILAFQELCSM